MKIVEKMMKSFGKSWKIVENDLDFFRENHGESEKYNLETLRKSAVLGCSSGEL